jgi:rhamnosyltransferase
LAAKKSDLKKSPRVAVLMATHDGAPWIECQVESILAQSGVAVTLYISDDGSRDGTYAFLKKIAKKNPRVMLLPQIKTFNNAARNFYHLIQSLDTKKFDYVSFADQDDIWAGDRLSRAIDVMKMHGAPCYSSDVLAFWENGKTKPIKKSQDQVAFDYLFESAGPGCTFVLTAESMAVFKSHISKSKNSVDEILHHDWLVYAFMRAREFKWVIDDYLGVQYRQHTRNEMGAHIGFKASLKRVRYILSGAWLAQVRMVANFCGQPQKQFIQRYLKLKHERFFSLAFKTHLLRRRSRDVFVLRFIFLGLGLKKLLTRA